ncbi:MAG: hypothetical protein HN350_08240 [Phycisphaerales bacterium]|jgi:hypothetical protein|nr:hypothetical protein [Phycisphaerales bacterium]
MTSTRTLKLKAFGRRITLACVSALCFMLLLSAAGCGGITAMSNPFSTKQYTILLHTFTGSEHVRQSKLYRDKAAELTDWSGLEVVHQDSSSGLYRGRYRTVDDAEADLNASRKWRAPNVNRPAFPLTKVVLVPGSTVELSKYDLRNAPDKGIWTVLVAAYVDDAKANFIGRERQEHAIKYCNWLREHGYEAYYHHLAKRTNITIGVFPENAYGFAPKGNTKASLDMHRPIYGKQVAKDPEMIKIMDTEEPPLRFLVINNRREFKWGRSKSKKHPVRVYTRSYPILIPGRTFAPLPLYRDRVRSDGGVER